MKDTLQTPYIEETLQALSTITIETMSTYIKLKLKISQRKKRLRAARGEQTHYAPKSNNKTNKLAT